MLDNITSGDDYAKLIIQNILEVEETLPAEEKMGHDLILIWFRNIKKVANQKWFDYITGNIDTFLLSDEEFTDTINKAQEELISETLGDLVDKDYVKMAIGDDGEILYSLTEQGKIEAQKIQGNE